MSQVFVYIEYEYSRVMVSTVTETQENFGAISSRRNININFLNPAKCSVRWMNVSGYEVLTFLSDISGMVCILLCRAQLNYCIFIQLFQDSFIWIKMQSALNLQSLALYFSHRVCVLPFYVCRKSSQMEICSS